MSRDVIKDTLRKDFGSFDINKRMKRKNNNCWDNKKVRRPQILCNGQQDNVFNKR